MSPLWISTTPPTFQSQTNTSCLALQLVISLDSPARRFKPTANSDSVLEPSTEETCLDSLETNTTQTKSKLLRLLSPESKNNKLTAITAKKHIFTRSTAKTSALKMGQLSCSLEEALMLMCGIWTSKKKGKWSKKWNRIVQAVACLLQPPSSAPIMNGLSTPPDMIGVKACSDWKMQKNPKYLPVKSVQTTLPKWQKTDEFDTHDITPSIVCLHFQTLNLYSLIL